MKRFPLPPAGKVKIADYGEPDMADPGVSSNFLSRGIKTVPTKEINMPSAVGAIDDVFSIAQLPATIRHIPYFCIPYLCSGIVEFY